MSVSVLMPVYNGERFLAEAIESVLGQTFREFELIVVNDGSSDSTREIVEEYAHRDSRIITLHQENRGLPASLNRGLRQARHELIARIDADDRMLPDRLRRQVWFLQQNPDVSVACSYGYFIDVRGRRVGKSGNPVDVDRGLNELTPSLFLDIIHPSVMMRKTDILAVGGYNENFPYAEDRDLWGRLATGGYRIACQDETLVEYRLHGGAMTAHNARRQRTICQYIDTNIIRRTRNQPELSMEEFQDWCKRQSRFTRWKHHADFTARNKLQDASRFYAEQKWGRCALSLLWAVSLRPWKSLNRIASKCSY